MPACRECAGRDLAFASASAAFCYEGPARALVTACKFRALRSLTDDLAARAAPAFAAAAARAGADAVVTWVPGPPRPPARARLRPGRVARPRGLRADAGLAYAPLLRRVRHGARQSGLDRAARAANVHDAFALREGGFGVVIDSSE